jgi:hypothetical protein
LTLDLDRHAHEWQDGLELQGLPFRS